MKVYFSQNIYVSQFCDIHFSYSPQRGCDIYERIYSHTNIHDQDLGNLTKENSFNLEAFGDRKQLKKD